MSPQAETQVSRVLHSGYIGQGKEVEFFERALKEYFRPSESYPLVTNSCTSALTLALHLTDSVGYQVITPPINCLAGPAAIWAAGMNIRWVDVDRWGNIDLADLHSKISPTTAVIMFPHLCGIPVDLKKLYDILRHFSANTGRTIWIIEDCAHALGSHYRGEKVGAQHLETIAPYPWTLKTFSFQAVKPLTTGDGGALLLPNAQLLERAKLLRWYGLDRTKDRYTQDVEEVGFKYQMNDIAATIGISNLQKLPEILEAQHQNWHYYQRELIEFKEVLHWWPMLADGSACSLYPIWVNDKSSFMAFMLAKDIEVAPPHVRSDKYGCFSFLKEKLKGVDDYEKHVVCIPAGWWVGEFEREYIVSSIREWTERPHVIQA